MKPDIAIVFYNDHGLNFFLDTEAPFAGAPDVSWPIIEQLVRDEFDVCTCQEMLVDHAFTIPTQLLWAERPAGVRFVPIHINTIQHPFPSPARCYNLGRSVGRAIASLPANLRVVVIGTGGLSHQLDGTRAGFINRAFDEYCLERIVDRPGELAELSTLSLIEQAGSQGAEFVMWLAMRGALGTHVNRLESTYHIPISNTAGGALLLEPA
jgi:protocatechuate 4,5-dioxygenase beta chain